MKRTFEVAFITNERVSAPYGIGSILAFYANDGGAVVREEACR